MTVELFGGDWLGQVVVTCDPHLVSAVFDRSLDGTAFDKPDSSHTFNLASSTSAATLQSVALVSRTLYVTHAERVSAWVRQLTQCPCTCQLTSTCWSPYGIMLASMRRYFIILDCHGLCARLGALMPFCNGLILNVQTRLFLCMFRQACLEPRVARAKRSTPTHVTLFGSANMHVQASLHLAQCWVV